MMKFTGATKAKSLGDDDIKNLMQKGAVKEPEILPARGWMEKQASKGIHMWQKRYFELQVGSLRYWDTSDTFRSHLGCFNIRNATIARGGACHSNKNNTTNIIVIEGPFIGRVLRLRFPTTQEADSFYTAISLSIDLSSKRKPAERTNSTQLIPSPSHNTLPTCPKPVKTTQSLHQPLMAFTILIDSDDIDKPMKHFSGLSYINAMLFPRLPNRVLVLRAIVRPPKPTLMQTIRRTIGSQEEVPSEDALSEMQNRIEKHSGIAKAKRIFTSECVSILIESGSPEGEINSLPHRRDELVVMNIREKHKTLKTAHEINRFSNILITPSAYRGGSVTDGGSTYLLVFDGTAEGKRAAILLRNIVDTRDKVLITHPVGLRDPTVAAQIVSSGAKRVRSIDFLPPDSDVPLHKYLKSLIAQKTSNDLKVNVLVCGSVNGSSFYRDLVDYLILKEPAVGIILTA